MLADGKARTAQIEKRINGREAETEGKIAGNDLSERLQGCLKALLSTIENPVREIEVAPRMNPVGMAVYAWMPKTIFSEGQERLLCLLREARENAGITQVELAETLGVPQSFVSKIESGERRVDLIELQAVCKALGISLTNFVQQFEEK